MSDEKKIEACPTRSGTHGAYQVEYRDRRLAAPKLGASEWSRVITKRAATGHGVPMDCLGEGVNLDLGLMSYEQAMAIAWHALADAVAHQEYALEFRVVPYRVHFKLEAFRLEEEAIPVPAREPQP